MKQKLSYVDVTSMKIIAILMVVTSHYFRFLNMSSALSFLKSMVYTFLMSLIINNCNQR